MDTQEASKTEQDAPIEEEAVETTEEMMPDELGPGIEVEDIDDFGAVLAEYEAQPVTCSTVCVWEILPAGESSGQSGHQPGLVSRRSRHQHLSSAR